MLVSLMWADVLLLGMWGDSGEVGIYSIAKRVAIVLGLMTYAVSISAPPRFATLYEQNRLEELARLARLTLGLMVLMGLPVLVVLTVFPEWVLRWFGGQFSAGASMLVVLAFAQFATYLHVVNFKLLIMAGKERLVSVVVTLVTVLNLGLNGWLIPEWGAVGAAWAYAASHFAMSLISTVALASTLSISALPWWRRSR